MNRGSWSCLPCRRPTLLPAMRPVDVAMPRQILLSSSIFISNRILYDLSADFSNMFSSSTRDRLRRSMSTHSMRKSNAPRQPTIDPDLAKAQAAAAASSAMRLSERSSAESRTSYDRLGGPNNVAVPRRRPNSSLRTAASSSCEPTMAPPRVNRAPSRSNRAHTSTDSAALSPIIEPRGLDGRDSSVPSSYRRLRNAKSMFSTRQHFSQNSRPSQFMTPRSYNDSEPNSGFSFPRTLRHSTSFARGRTGQPLHHAKSHDTAIQLAREQFIGEADNADSLRPSIFTHHRRKEQRPFRKTFRSTSEGSGASKLSRQPSFKSFHRRSRTFSSTIKSGIRRVFGFSKSVGQEPSSVGDTESPAPEESPAVPIQPIYVRKLTAETEDGFDSAASSPLRVTAIMSNTPSCIQGTRTTSRASTTTNLAAPNKRHNQPLSLIEEHGDLNNQLLVPGESNMTGPFGRPNQPIFDGRINTQDLYTALVRHQLERAAQSANEEIMYGNVAERRVVPERAPSVLSQQSRRTVRTVRRVPSVESSISPMSFATARGDSYSPFKHQHSAKYIQPSRYALNEESTRPSSVAMVPVSPQSAFIVQDSDEDTGSVVVACVSPKPESISPTSLYSRTTSGATPPKARDPRQDVGTVTILSSERTAYASPNRGIGPKLGAQPSADWQKWFSSEIERIEQTYPTRGHIRESAQLQDDDGPLTELLRQAAVSEQESTPTSESVQKLPDPGPPASLKAAPQSNFSRPFSRSSGVRTIQPTQDAEAKGITKASERQSQTKNAPPASMPIPNIPATDALLSPMRLRVSNMSQIPESPTPPPRSSNGSMKRVWTQEKYRRYSTRRPMVKAKPAQFRSMRTGRDSRYNNENARQHEHDDMMDEYCKMQEGQGTMSSKKMVEMFLDSRRQKMGLADNFDDASTVNEEAFI